MTVVNLDSLESVVSKVIVGVRIKAIDENRDLTVNQVIGYHPSVGFNFSGEYTVPAGVDSRTGRQAFGGRGFLFADFNKKWIFVEEGDE